MIGVNCSGDFDVTVQAFDTPDVAGAVEVDFPHADECPVGFESSSYNHVVSASGFVNSGGDYEFCGTGSNGFPPEIRNRGIGSVGKIIY